MSDSPTTIVALEVENFKRIKAAHITPKGDVVRITGENGAGKSSVLDAIAAALGGGKAQPDVPVRKGAKKAHVIVELPELVVERSWTQGGGTSLTVKSRDGSTLRSPQEILNRLLGDLSFDPLAFTRMEPKRQAEILRKLVGIDFSTLDQARAKIFEERTIVGREGERAQNRVQPVPPEARALPAAEQDVAELVQAHQALAHAHDLHRNDTNRMAALKETESELLRRLEQVRGQMKLCQVTLDQPPPSSEQVATALAAIQNVQRNNQLIRQRNEQAEIAKQARDLSDKYDALTEKLRLIDERKESMIADAKMPVEGLGFDEDGVKLNGVPFSQASTAEQLRTSVAIGARQNPQLRVILVRDASLLDEKSMRALEALAVEHKVQLWVERITDTSAARVVIEDGAVVEGGAA